MERTLSDHPDVDLVYGTMQCIGPDGRVLHSYPHGPPEELRVHNVVGGCFMYQRRMYEKLGDYAEDMFLVEDYDYWLRAWKHGRLLYLDGESLYYYRLHDGSLTQTRYAQQQLQLARVQWRHLRPTRREATWIARAHWDLAWYCRCNNDLERSALHALTALAGYPLAMQYWRTALGAILRLGASKIRTTKASHDRNDTAVRMHAPNGDTH